MKRPGPINQTAARKGKSNRRISFAAVLSPVLGLIGFTGLWILGFFAAILLGVARLTRKPRPHQF